MAENGCQILLRFGHFDICKFEFADYLRKEKYAIFEKSRSGARGGYTKSIQVLVLHFWTQNDHNNHLAIMKLIHFPDAPDQK